MSRHHQSRRVRGQTRPRYVQFQFASLTAAFCLRVTIESAIRNRTDYRLPMVTVVSRWGYNFRMSDDNSCCFLFSFYNLLLPADPTNYWGRFLNLHSSCELYNQWFELSIVVFSFVSTNDSSRSFVLHRHLCSCGRRESINECKVKSAKVVRLVKWNAAEGMLPL